MGLKNTIKVVLTTLLCALLSFVVKNDIDKRMFEEILGGAYSNISAEIVSFHIGATFIAIIVCAVMYMWMKKYICADDNVLKKKYEVTFIISWIITWIGLFAVEMIQNELYIHELKKNAIRNNIIDVILIFIIIKIIDVIINGINNKKISRVNGNKNISEVGESSEKIKVETNVGIVIITVLMGWLCLEHIPGIVLGEFLPLVLSILLFFVELLVTYLLPFIYVVLYVKNEYKLHKKETYISWIVSNVVIGGMDIVYNIMEGFHTGEGLINQTYFQRIMYLFTLIIGTSIFGGIIKLLKTQIGRNESNEDDEIDSEKIASNTIDKKESI